MIRARMLPIIVLLATLPFAAVAETFVTDRASPLRLADPKNAQLPTLKFKGTVRVSGKFVIARETYDQTNYYLRISMYPDDKSAALLPRLMRRERVKELNISNTEKAAAILIGQDNARAVLDGELPSAMIDADVTINRYIISVSCDQRFFLADLVSVAKKREMVAAGPRNRLGCG